MRSRGMWGVFGIAALLLVIVVAVVFLSLIMGSSDAAVNMTNSSYETQYDGLMGFYSGSTGIFMAVGIILAVGAVLMAAVLIKK